MEKIKVVFVHYKLVCGGAEQALFDLIRLMDKERFDVSVFVQEPGGVWEQKFIDGGIPVFYDYSCRKATLNPFVKAGNVVKKLRTDAAYKRGGEGLLDVILPESPDIVISYSAWFQDKIAFTQTGKTVKYIHGDPGTNEAYRKEAENEKQLLSRFDRIVCVSEAAWNSFRQISGLTEGVELHYNPINSDQVREKAQETVEMPADVPLICAVGRLSEEKGFERLVYLHKELLREGIFHRLVIVGDGPDRERVERAVQATQTHGSVILAGYQSNPYPYMKQSKFLVSSSYTEGLPVIAMEALCLGTPIVAAVPSVGEVFGGEVCGVITENDNDSLKAGIRKMLTEETFYARAKAGAEKRSAFFDGKRMVSEVEKMLLELMEQDS
ncbi:MAG: glycosyltransferase [Oscillospiraceae bacterium]|nr:glycosyltransferase [Oscillospiraceae bacterium]